MREARLGVTGTLASSALFPSHFADGRCASAAFYSFDWIKRFIYSIDLMPIRQG
jgi:hypothetical protein